MAKQTAQKATATDAQGGRAARSAAIRAPGGDAASRRNRTSPAVFFQESYAELQKVTWPTRQEATNLTVAVIAMTLAIAAFLGAIDTLLDQLVKPILGG